MKITIKGKEYGLHWGLGAIECASEIYEIPENTLFLESISRDYDIEDNEIKSIGKEYGVIKEVVLGAIVNWCDENDVKVDFTPKNFTNAFNELTVDDRNTLLIEYKKSIYNGRVVEEIFDEILSKHVVKEDTNKVKKKARTTSK